MARIGYYLLTKENLHGQVQVGLRVFITQDVRIRGVQSQVWISLSRWNKKTNEVIVPTTPGDERTKLLETRELLNSLWSAMDNAICDYEDKEGLTRELLQEVVNKFHRARKKKRQSTDEEIEVKKTLIDIMEDYLQTKKLCQSRKDHIKVFMRSLMRYELYQKAQGRRSYKLFLDKVTQETLSEIEWFFGNEHVVFDKYPEIYEKMPVRIRNTGPLKTPEKYLRRKAGPDRGRPKERGINYISDMMIRFRSFMIWAYKNKLIATNPFEGYSIDEPVYGDPIYITVDEIHQLLNADMSDNSQLEAQRDIFVLQSFIGCRVGDYLEMTQHNLINGAIEYIANKTNTKRPKTLRVPLNDIALRILHKHYDPAHPALMPFISEDKYNDYIKLAFKRAGLTRMVTVMNQITHKNEQRPLNEVASSHMARRTFIGNIYKNVKDPNLVGALSGHKEGSKAFARYRHIDEDMKKELVNFLVK